MADYRISLGVDVDLDDIKSQINSIKPDPIDLDVRINSKNLQSQINNINTKFANTKANLANSIKLKLDNSTFNNQVSKMVSDFNKLSNKTAEVKKALGNLTNAFTGMKNAYKSGNDDALIAANEKYLRSLKDVENQIKINKREEQDLQNASILDNKRTGLLAETKQWLKENSAAAKQFGGRIKEIQIALASCKTDGQFKKISSDFASIKKEAREAGVATQTFGDKLKTQLSKYSAYFSVATLFMWTTQGLKDMFQQVLVIDTAMTELKKVTNETDASYNKFLSNAAQRSKELGTTIDGLVSSTADFARLGYDFEESQGLAEVANIYAVVGDEIDGVDGATQSLVSTLAAFKHEMGDMSDSEFAMSIVDKFNEVSNNFSISSGGIGEALQRSASSLATANSTLDESIALITAANTVVQDPEKVGNAMKTISMRIRGAKTELEAMGEDTTGMVESTAKLREEIMALSGVDIMLNEDTFKAPFQIMDELSQKWESLSDIAQASIIELIAGKHQGNVFSSLMANFDTAREVLETSINSSGSAMEEHAKWSNSLEARLNKLKSTWQSFSQSFMNSDLLKGGISLLTGLVNVLEKIVNNLGLFGTIGLGFIGKGIFETFKYFKGAKDIPKTIDDVVSSIDNLTNIMSGGANAASEMGEAMSSAVSTAAETAETTSNIASASTEAAEAATNVGSASTEAAEATSNLASASTEATEAISNIASASTEAAEAMGNIASVATEATEAVSNIASASTEAAEASANLASGGTEIIESVGNIASVATEATEAAVNVGSAVVTAGAGAGAAAGGFKAFAASSAGIALGIGVAIVAIGLVVNAVKNYKDEISDLRQETIKTSDEFLDASVSFEQAYAKYSGKTSLTSDEEAELASSIHATVDALGDKSSALQNVVNGSNDYIASLEAIADAELEAANKAAKDKKNAAKLELNDIVKGWSGFDGSEVDVQLGTSADEAVKIAKEIGGEFYNNIAHGKDANREVFTLTLDADASIDETLDYYYTLLEYKDRLSEADLIDTTAYDNVSIAIGKMSDAVAVYEDGVYEAAKASYQLENGIPRTVNEYLKMREAVLGEIGGTVETKKTIAGTLDSEYGKVFDLTTAEVQARKLIGIVDGFTDSHANELEVFLNLKTALNNGECTIGDYMSQFDEIENMLGGFSEAAQKEIKMAFGLDTDNIKTQYSELFNDLSRHMGEDNAKEFLNGLSSSELSSAFSRKGKIDWEGDSPEDIKAQIKEQARLTEALNFTIKIETQTEGIEALNTALSEARSATGLTAESIAALQSRYEDLDGFNAAALFENTALGVRLNNEELSRLEAQYETVNKLDIDKNLDTLVTKYKELTEQIKNCTNEQEKETLKLEANAYADKIKELQTLASQYDGLTSAFNKWVNAQSSANDGDNYDSIYDALEGMKELRDKGLVGTDDFKTAAQLMTNKDLSNASVDEYVAAFDKGYPDMKRYFTDTNKGCKNFLNDISKINSEWAHLNEDGKWEINFDAEDVAKSLDKSVDFVHLMAQKLKDYGFEINIDDTSLDDLQTKIEEKEAALRELGKNPYPVNLDIEASSENLGAIESEIDKIKAHISEVNNSTAEPNVKTAQLEDAQAKLEALIEKKQEASQPAFMNLNTSQVNASLVEALEKVQAYQTALNDLNKLNELKGAGISIDDSQITAAQEKANECAKAIQGLDGEVKVAIGLEEDGSVDSIKKAFEEGKVNIDANTDPAITKVEMLAENIERIEDKDVTINVAVNGLEDVKELNRQIDLATNIDGDIDSLSKYVENAKALNELDSNIATYVSANVKGNVIKTPEYMINNLKTFTDSASGLKDIGNVTSNVTANIDGNVKDTPEFSINNLKTFTESAKDLDSVPDNVNKSIYANIDGNVKDTAEFQINNLKTFTDSASGLSNIPDSVSKTVSANISGNVKDTAEFIINNISAFADSAKTLEGVPDNVTKTVYANIEGNVKDTFEFQINNLKTFTDSASDLSSIPDNVNKTVSANIGGNVKDTFEFEINNLKVFSDSAKTLEGIPDNISKIVSANVEGDVIRTPEGILNNISAFADSAKTLDGIPDNVNKTVSANIDGNVKDTFEFEINNLKVFSDSAKDLDSMPDNVDKTVSANIEGNVKDTFEFQINNLETFTDSAKNLDSIPDNVNKTVSANINGDVLLTPEGIINNISVFAESAKTLNGIPDNVSKTVSANVEGNVTDTFEFEINNLNVFADSAKTLDGVPDNVNKTVSANIEGNVKDTFEFDINNISAFAESAKTLEGIPDNISKTVSANINGDVTDTFEFQINNLKTFAESAKTLEGIPDDVNKTVSANINGDVLLTPEGMINNVIVFAESAKTLNGVPDNVSKTVSANISGTVLTTSEKNIGKLGTFADNAKKVEDVDSFSSSVTASIDGNIITDDTAVSDLEYFASVASGLSNQSVSIDVTANVDSANIDNAVNSLIKVSDSGIFKDYDANVSVTAQVSGDDKINSFKTILSNIKDKTVNIFVKGAEAAVGAINSVKNALNSIKDKTIKIKADKYGSTQPEPVAKSTEVNYVLGDQDVPVDKTALVNYSLGTQEAPVSKTVTVNYKRGWQQPPLNMTAMVTYVRGTAAGVNGTANADGTAFANGTIGKAFKQGDWGTKDSGVALMGELGRETIVRDGRFFTVGDTGAGFYQYKKGDIIFNHKQTEELFKNGKVTSGGGRGKMFVNGTAFAEGTAFSGGITGSGSFTTVVATNSVTGTNYTRTTSEGQEPFQETLDLIEIAIDRIEREIDSLDAKASNVYKVWAERNEALINQIGKVGEAIDIQQKAYDKYMEAAAGVGLSADWVKKIQDGSISIESINDEALKQQIDDYKEW